jgi:peptidoglycan hydrolase-like protein with peptidoglycan-binding domain
MSRLLFKRANRGVRGVRGQIVTDIQNALGHSGHPVPTVDGVYGGDTQTAVSAFQTDQGLQATGEVDDVTFEKLTNAAIPPVFHRALQITADYEGTGFALANGNFDGAGITWGIVGFTLSNGELGRMLQQIDQQLPRVFSNAFGPLAARLRQVLAGSHADQMAFANSISIGNGNHVAHDWDEAFHQLGADPEVQDIQLARVDTVYKKIADDNAATLGLQEELSVALCFDVSVQNGGLKQSEVARVQQATAGQSEKQKRRFIAELVADRSNPRFRKDVLDRKMSFASGAGTVHGDEYELDGWGLA